MHVAGSPLALRPVDVPVALVLPEVLESQLNPELLSLAFESLLALEKPQQGGTRRQQGQEKPQQGALPQQKRQRKAIGSQRGAVLQKKLHKKPHKPQKKCQRQGQRMSRSGRLIRENLPVSV